MVGRQALGHMLETLGLKPAARHRSREVLPYRQGGRRPNFEERMTTARHFRVFPGEGVHSDELADLVRRLGAIGYTGDYSFEVFNDAYQQLPLPVVAKRARKSALWLAEDVPRRSTPLPDRMTLRRVVLRGWAASSPGLQSET